jgi:hypothetical protein
VTKRGRGQRRSRRLKNRSTSLPRRLALEHIRFNRLSASYVPELTAFFRAMDRITARLLGRQAHA